MELRKIQGNKKGAEMTIGTLVIIVLAVIVLVVLAVGFGTGWGNLWNKIRMFFGGGANVDSVVQSCNLACSSNSRYAYCNQERDVDYEEKGEMKTVTATCVQIEEGGKLSDLDIKIECDNIDCPEDSVTYYVNEEGNCEEKSGNPNDYDGETYESEDECIEANPAS